MTTILHGDWLARLREQPERRFRTCVTSPPYLWQRRYLPEDHPDTHLEVGREATIESYVLRLVEGMREVRRVLADDGTLWLNIGDTYSAGGLGGGGSFMKLREKSAWRGKSGKSGWRPPPPGLAEKQLLGIPWRVALALQGDGWWLRSEIIWEKPNALPASVNDRPTCAHEHVFLLAKSPVYFFNMNAVREPYVSAERAGRPISGSSFRGQRNMRTVWRIPTERTGTEHTAPMPRALARRCVLAGSAMGDDVLDPFGGSGTVGIVCEEDGRRATLIDLDERSTALARRRCAQVGLFAQRRGEAPAQH